MAGNRLRSWTYQRQLLGGLGGDPLEALRQIVGVYSTHPTAPLALLTRCHLEPGDLASMEQRREVVRVPAMRGSVFLLPADTAARIFAATRESENRLVRRLRVFGLEEADYRRLVPLVLEACATPATRSRIRECGRPDEDAYGVARALSREGKLLRVGASLRMDQLKWVSTEAWLGHALEEVDPMQALVWLASEYLRAFGPARLADFAWWAGASRHAAAAALQRVTTVDVGDGLLLLESDLDAFERVQPIDSEAIAVLPKWDSYTMGYAPDGRQRFVDDQYLSRAYTAIAGSPGATAGDGQPLVLRAGRAVASWSHRFEGNRMCITTSPFESDKLPATAFDAVGQLLGASAVDVR